MKKFVLAWMIFIQSSLSPALASAPSHNDHSIGVHGMALFSIDGQLIASHMPLHGGRHSHQIILTLKTNDHVKVDDLVQGSELITLEPEQFSLNKLRSGELKSFSARVFKGHFERGGKADQDPIRFEVTGKLLDQPLRQGGNGSYQLVQHNNFALLIHEIASNPSFDQILLVNVTPNSPIEISIDSEKPLTSKSWPEKLTKAGIDLKKQLYFESQDFQ